jgi:hypothetical protein
MIWLRLKPIGPSTFAVAEASDKERAGWVRVSRRPSWPVAGTLYNPAFWNEEKPLRLSVILVHYNETPALRRCLKAIDDQNLDKKDFEVIVADDGTMGREGDLLREAVCEYSRRMHVRLVVNPREDPKFIRNCATVSNAGFAAALGRVVVRMSAHIIPASPHSLGLQLAMHEGIGFGRLKGGLVSLPEGLSKQVVGGADPEPFFRLLKPGLYAPTAIFLEDVLRIGGMSQCFPGWGGEDTLFYLYLDRAGVGISAVMPELKYVHLWHRIRTADQGILSYNIYQQLKRIPGNIAIHSLPASIDPYRMDPDVKVELFRGADLTRFTLCKP